MTDKTEKEEDAPVALKRKATSQQTGITLRLGPDSKMSLPIQGGNLLMMVVIAGQLFFKFAGLPDAVTAIAKDLTEMSAKIDGLESQGTERDKSIGSLETRVEILEDDREKLSAKVLNLESAKSKSETQITELEKENEKLVTCIRRPSKCRL